MEETELPTRVLQISGSPEDSLVKLIETKGMKGCYCALNHCWGPVNKRPPMTTRANLQAHLERIPFEQLSRTFGDTVMLVQGIGIEFIWIGSLCIIQNDARDWESEAKTMGRAYSNATLVIAAAGSRDSTEGLFVTERPQPTIVRLPYVLDDIIKGSFNVALMPHPDPRPTLGPLSERAWAFQEGIWHGDSYSSCLVILHLIVIQ